jgi:hypothetical protein
VAGSLRASLESLLATLKGVHRNLSK